MSSTQVVAPRSRTRPVDVVLTVALSGLGVLLMVMNMGGEGQDVRIDSTSVWMVPVWLAATVPVLWWRRNLLAVVAVSTAAMAAHVLLFGWVVRCGAGLPLVFVLGFLSGVAYERRRALWALGGTAVLTALVLVKDSAAGAGLIPVALLIVAVMAGIGSGRATTLGARRRARRAQRGAPRAARRASRALRLRRPGPAVPAARHVAGRAAEPARRSPPTRSTRPRDPETQRAALVRIEENGRRTLGDMREVVGLLRGGEAGVAPAPSVAHLDALLAKHLGCRRPPAGRRRPPRAPRQRRALGVPHRRAPRHCAGAGPGRSPRRRDARSATTPWRCWSPGPVPRGADLRGAVGPGARARGPPPGVARRDRDQGTGQRGGPPAGAERCLIMTDGPALRPSTSSSVCWPCSGAVPMLLGHRPGDVAEVAGRPVPARVGARPWPGGGSAPLVPVLAGPVLGLVALATGLRPARLRPHRRSSPSPPWPRSGSRAGPRGSWPGVFAALPRRDLRRDRRHEHRADHADGPGLGGRDGPAPAPARPPRSSRSGPGSWRWSARCSPTCRCATSAPGSRRSCTTSSGTRSARSWCRPRPASASSTASPERPRSSARRDRRVGPAGPGRPAAPGRPPRRHRGAQPRPLPGRRDRRVGGARRAARDVPARGGPGRRRVGDRRTSPSASCRRA